MKILFLDTSSFFVTVSIMEGNNVLYLYQNEIKDDMSSKIMPIISEGFSQVAFTVKDIDKIMVVNGPGSFTGVRIGVTIAKTLAWSLNKEIITISSLEYIATTKCLTKYVIPMIDARRGYVYASVYSSSLDEIVKDRYMAYSELSDYFNQGTIVSYDGLPNSMKPKVDISIIVNKHINDIPTNCHEVKPNYLKVTEAEESFRKKND